MERNLLEFECPEIKPLVNIGSRSGSSSRIIRSRGTQRKTSLDSSIEQAKLSSREHLFRQHSSVDLGTTPAMRISKIKSTTIPIYIQDPNMEKEIESHGRRPSSSDSLRHVIRILNVDLKDTAQNIIVKCVRETFGSRYVEKIGGDLGVLDRFGMYEEEFFYDNHSSSCSVQFPSSSNGFDMRLAARKRSISSGVKRRPVRLLALDEHPLFIIRNWRYAKPRLKSDFSGLVEVPRHMHFMIKVLSFDDRMNVRDDLRRLAGIKQSKKSSLKSLVVSQSLASVSFDDLKERLDVLKIEEFTEIEDVKKRYFKQMAWLKECYKLENNFS